MKNILFLFILFSLACGTTNTDTTLKEEDNKEEPSTKESTCESIEMDTRNYETAPADPFEIKGVRIEEDCLAVDVSYSGGCGGAEFKMFGQATIGKTPPPTILLKLSLDDQDNCRSIVEKTLFFNLKDVQQTYNTEVALQLKGMQRQITYSY